MTLKIFFVLLLTSSSVFAVDSTSFNRNAAIQTAGNLVDKNKTIFFAFYIPADAYFPTTSISLVGNLQDSSKKNGSLAIIGPDYSLNYKLLKSALEITDDASLKGSQIIFIGDNANFDELSGLAKKAGASFNASTCCGK